MNLIIKDFSIYLINFIDLFYYDDNEINKRYFLNPIDLIISLN